MSFAGQLESRGVGFIMEPETNTMTYQRKKEVCSLKTIHLSKENQPKN